MDLTEEQKAKIREWNERERLQREKADQERAAELAVGNRAKRRRLAAKERKE